MRGRGWGGGGRDEGRGEDGGTVEEEGGMRVVMMSVWV